MVGAWASAFPAIRLALAGVEPMPLAAVRFALASVPATIWLCWRRPVRPTASEGIRILLCGLFGIALYNAALNTGEITVTAGAASFIGNVAPLITALLAAAVLGERLGRLFWIGSCLSLAGVGLIASVQPGGLAVGAGTSLVAAAACCYACYAVLQRPLVARHGALVPTALTLVCGALLLSPWLGAGVRQLTSRNQPGVVAAVIELGCVPSIVGYGAWSYVVGRLGPSRTSNFLYLVPPTALVLSLALGGERSTMTLIMGGVLAVGGVVLANAARFRLASAPSGVPRRGEVSASGAEHAVGTATSRASRVRNGH